MKIFIPHIFYTVYVKDIKKTKGDAKEFLDRGFTACAEKVDKNTSNIYIEFPVTPKSHGTVLHEVIHVIGHICQDRDISFINEEEHVAYIAQYIFNRITGYEYE